MQAELLSEDLLSQALPVSQRSAGRVTTRPQHHFDSPSTCSIVIVSYHTGPILLEALKSVLAEADVDQVLLVDNGNPLSIQVAVDAVATSEDRLQVMRGHGNVGFARGCNIGVRAATGSHILLLNPDCLLRPGVVRRGLDVFAERPGTSALTVRIENIDGSEQRGVRRNLLTPWTCVVELTRLDRLLPKHGWVRRVNLNETEPLTEITDVPCISGAFMMMPRRIYNQLGGMDEVYFLHVEDVDFCFRIHTNGGKILYIPDVAVTHVGGTSDISAVAVEWNKSISMTRYFNKHFWENYPAVLILLINFALVCRFAVRVLPLALTRVLRVRHR